MNVELILVRQQLGTTSLGHHQNARSLTDEIRSRMAAPLQCVLFPGFSSLPHDRARMQAAMLRSVSLLAAVAFPLGVGVSAMVAELGSPLYRDQWLPMVPALGMFGLSTALCASWAIASPLFNAHHRVGLALRYTIVATTLMVAGIGATLTYGITTVSTAVMLTSLHALLPCVAALHLVGLGSAHAARILVPPALVLGGCWVVIHVARPFATSWATGAGLLLALGNNLSLVLYAAVLQAIYSDYYSELCALFSRILLDAPAP